MNLKKKISDAANASVNLVKKTPTPVVLTVAYTAIGACAVAGWIGINKIEARQLAALNLDQYR